MPDENQPSSEAAAPAVCATLFIHNLRNRHQRVWGASGKVYEFRWNEAQGRLVREYQSVAQFTAEELDMRRNRVSQFTICTLIGSTHPATHALEALNGLIAASRQVAVPDRIGAMLQMQATIETELARLMSPPAEEPEPAPEKPATATPAPSFGVPLETKEWRDAQTGAAAPLTSKDGDAATPALTKAAPLDGQHTHEELMKMDWNLLRKLARDWAERGGEPSGKIGTMSRSEVADYVLGHEAKLSIAG